MKLQDILNEAKSFSAVKKGDVGEDYAGHQVKILDKAMGRKAFRKISRYDDSGAMEDFLDSEEELSYSGIDNVEKIPMVAVELIDGPAKGEKAVFTYGDDGVTVSPSAKGIKSAVVDKKAVSKQSKPKTKLRQVKKGDFGEDYSGEKFKVLATAPAGKFRSIRKYDRSGMMEDMIDEEGDDFDMVAVEYDKGMKQAVLVFDEVVIY